MVNIHPSAIVSPKAELGDNIIISAGAVVYDDVEIGDNTIIGPHAVIYDGARIGKNVKIFQGASVSNLPQDLKFSDEQTLFYIGDNTQIREFATLHRGTVETGFSRIGKNCLLMAYSHVAHDCIIGDNCILANSVQIGGHVEIEDWVIIGGTTPIHQFCKIGKHAMVGGGFRVTVDVPPFVLAANDPLRYTGINLVGLRRRGFSNDEIMEIKEAYKLLYKSGLNTTQAVEKLKETFPGNKNIDSIMAFIEKSNRTLLRA